MAVIGSLVVNLSARTAEFTAGMNNAATVARTTANSVGRSLDDMLKGINRPQQRVHPEGFAQQFGTDDLGAQAASIFESLQTPTEKYQASVEKLSMLLNKGYISSATWARGIARSQDALKSMQPVLDETSNRFQRLFNIIGRTTLGRRGLGLFSALSEATGLSVGFTAAAAAAAVVVVSAVRLGNSIKEAEKEAARLGITFEQLAYQQGNLVLSERSREALKDAASAWETIWKWTKLVTAELIAQTVIQLRQDSRRSMGIRDGKWVRVKDDDKPLSDFAQELMQRVADKRLANVNSGISTLRQLKKEDELFGKSEWEKIEYDLRSKGIGSDFISEAKKSWDSIEKKKMIEAADAQLKDKDSYFEDKSKWTRMSDAMYEGIENASLLSETLEKLNAGWAEADRVFERMVKTGKQLAETPIDRFQEKMKALYAALEAGIGGGGIDQSQFDAAVGELRTDTVAAMSKDLGQPQLAGAMKMGSQEAYSAIVRYQTGGKESEQVRLARRQVKAAEDNVIETRKVREKIEVPIVADFN